MRPLALLACCIAACGAATGNGNGNGNANGNANANEAHAALPGDTLAFRFVDHAGEAEARGDFAAAFRALAHPQKALLPYADLAGDAAYRAVAIAFADADVEDYPADGARAHPVQAYDPVWNRTRAVYLSRSALYLPGRASQRYRVPIPDGARLETALGLVGARATFRVRVDGETVFERALADADRWQRETIDLARFAGRTAVVEFTVDGADAHGFFADPLLWRRGGGAPGPNLLVIVVDTLRADAFAAMPKTAAWARGAARFDQAITGATWTRPSLLALYGGDLPSAVGQSAETMIPDDAERRRFYRVAPPLLPRLLAARGWRASAIGNNFFLLAYPQIGLDLGFEEVDDVRHPVLDTPAITRAAVRYLRENRDRAWLLHLHYDAPHWPYTPPAGIAAPHIGDAALQKDPLWAKYLAEAAWADGAVAEVLAELSRLGIAERTLVVLVGDHGEAFDPAHAHTVEALGLPTLHHHGWSAYDEVLRVPLVVAMPGKIAPAEPASQVRLYDVAATAADYLGVDLPLPSRGRSLRAVAEGRERADRVAVSEGQDVRTLRDGRWLYLVRDDGRLTFPDGRRADVREELYDVAADPMQHHDLAGDPSARAKLAELRARFAAEAPPRPASHYHLRAGAATGTLRTPGRIIPRAGGLADPHALDVRGDLDFDVEPPESPLTLQLAAAGAPLPVERVLVGEFALPLVDGPLAGDRLVRLEARRPPILDAAHVFLWRDAVGRRAAAPDAPSTTSDEVTGMMKRWGYAQPEK